METIGNITKMLTYTFEWSIKDYFSLPQAVNTVHISPDFDFGNTTWCLKIYPNGDEDNDSTGYVGLCLEKVQKFRFEKHLVTCKLSLLDRNGDDYSYQRFKQELISGWRFPEFEKRSQLLKDREIIAPNGILTISCTLSCKELPAEEKRQTPVFENVDKVTQNLKELLLSISTQDSEQTLETEDQLLQSHRLILRACSPIVPSMFQNSIEFSEIVDIKDSNPDTLYDFLLCLHSRKPEKLSTSNVYSRYSMAVKYDVDDIKKECVEFMEKELSVDSVCDVLASAIRYNEQTLIESATSFFTNNAKDVILTIQWKTFLKENLDAANELFIKVLKDMVPIFGCSG